MHRDAWLWIYEGSRGGTGIEMCGAKATLGRILLNNKSFFGIKAWELFSQVWRNPNNLHALLPTDCGVERNLQ